MSPSNYVVYKRMRLEMIQHFEYIQSSSDRCLEIRNLRLIIQMDGTLTPLNIKTLIVQEYELTWSIERGLKLIRINPCDKYLTRQRPEWCLQDFYLRGNAPKGFLMIRRMMLLFWSGVLYWIYSFKTKWQIGLFVFVFPRRRKNERGWSRNLGLIAQPCSLHMKGIFDPYVLWPFNKKLIS